MALLNTPQGQQSIVIPITPNMELEFGFDPGSETQLSREGDSLIFTFEDGGQIVLTDFYALPVEELPALDIQGAQISAEDFLVSLGDETLLPAAGPTAPQAATPDSSGSGAYTDGAGGLIGGVDSLGTLGRDFWGGTTRPPLTDEGVLLADAAVTPPSPGPEPEPENFIPSISKEPNNLTVHEDGLPNGTEAGESEHPTVATGTLAITSVDDLATIKIGGLTLTILGVDPDGKVNFSVSGDETVPYGDFTIAGLTKNGDVYTLEYSYELTGPSDEHTAENVDHESLPDKIQIPVEAIDNNGDSTGEQSFTLDILDDGPVAHDEEITLGTSDSSLTINVLDNSVSDNDVYGADGEAAADALAWGDVKWDGQLLNVDEDGNMIGSEDGKFYGTLTRDENGDVTYARPEKTEIKGELTVDYALTDKDGDTAEATLTIDVDENKFVPSITGAPDNLTVHEDGLPSGTEAGSSDHPTTATGSLAITSTEDLATIKIAGLTLTLTINPDGSVSFTTAGNETVDFGNFSILGITKENDVYTVNYKYELTNATEDHTVKNLDHESLPDKIDIPVEAIDKTGDSTGEQSFTLDILDDNPETNSDWVTIAPTSTDTIYGNLNDGMWGTSKGDYTNSAAESGEGDGAADNWGADGGRVTKITDAEGNAYDVPETGYVDVPTDSGTLRVYSNGDYEFTPNVSYEDKTLVDFDNALHAKYDSKHSAEVEGYTLEAMAYDPATGKFTPADFHITNNVDRQIGVKHGDTVDDGHKNEISTYTDKSGKTVSEGVLITMPTNSTATSMSFSLTEFRNNVEQANWIIVYADGTVVKGSSALSEFTLDFSNEHGPVESVFIYANDDDKTSFFIDKMATHEAEQLPFKDTTFDYQVTDGDGDTSTSQLHINGDEMDEPMTKAAAADPTSPVGPDDDPRHTLDDNANDNVVRGVAHSGSLAGGKTDDTTREEDGDEHIAGDGDNNTIHGGLDNDILSGGDGDDIFVWTAGDKDHSEGPLVDTIKDFSMNNLAGKGDDQIDLRDLLSGATEGTLDKYLSITRVGDSAELHIHADGNPTGAATQVIVLENVYATHGSADNSTDVNELIKQHVILNS